MKLVLADQRGTQGMDGDDTLYGAMGDGNVAGGKGSDVVWGNRGDDVLRDAEARRGRRRLRDRCLLRETTCEE